MTNTVLLKNKIAEKGLSYTYIAKKLGISRQCFYNKLTNKTEFLVSEIAKLCEILEITSLREKEMIFYAKDVTEK